MSKAADEIQAQSAPLSHLNNKEQHATLRDRIDWRGAAVAALVVIVLVTAFVWRPALLNAPSTTSLNTNTPSANPAGAANARNDNQLAPFAETQRQRAREKAQDALAEFVELQIKLEETMQVDAWGSAELADAMAQAQFGDEEFVAQRFETSLQAYQRATSELQKVIALGEKLFQENLNNGMTLIDDKEPEAAIEALQAALTIKPDDQLAQQQFQRAQQLPDLISKLRTAKNHELGGRYNEALTIYQEIEQIDPQIKGLQALKNSVAEAQTGNNLTSYLSAGFAALSDKRFDAARQAFKQALVLDPDNDIAKGGLQQVAQQNDLSIITRHQQQATKFINAEQWQQAIDEYQAVLDIDSNIQFALNGRSTARAHLRAQRLLDKIAAEPQKLSSEKLYLDAVAIAEEAQSLTAAGPVMAASLATVNRLLKLYRDPVDVVLLSDNATEVVMSNVGRLGAFERKTLSLRPGQYTIRGSQNGCRDIFLNVEVLPGIAPLDISCAEPIN
jgi:tetratricopeptide (TPR) repeat protein